MTRFEKIREEESSRILLASHRGISGGNIPPNSLTAFEIALRQGADIMELDLAKSTDGSLFVYHPGTETRWLLEADGHNIEELSSAKIRTLHLTASDGVSTAEHVPTMDEMLELLKDRCYINLDKCWTCLPELVPYVRRHGMEDQILLKSVPKPAYLDLVEAYAPDLRYLPIYKNAESVDLDALFSHNIRFYGAELVFASDTSYLCSDDCLDAMHRRGLKLWANAILYNVAVPLAGGHSDDRSLAGHPEDGWGWLADRGFDIIQTDWCAMARSYLTHTGKIRIRR